MNKKTLIRKVFDAGVVGAGGAGFPTHVKLGATGADTYLINGAECEPLLDADCHLMTTMAKELVDAGRITAEALGARLLFGVKAKHAEAVDALRSAGADVFEARDYYPLGDEVILIADALGRTVPEGHLPTEVGVVVNNVETLLNIHGALAGTPVTHTFVSTGGAVGRPTLFRAPIGTNARELLEVSGGIGIDPADAVFVDGGPMMGRYSDTPDFPVTKTTKGILVLPRDSLLATLEQMPVEEMLKRARVCCCQCNQCTVACSRYLVGMGIEPHKIMRAMAWAGTRNGEVLRMALLCSECNLCSALHACPMGLSPRRVNQQIKKALRESGVTPAFVKKEASPHPLREYRLAPSGRIKERLGLSVYDRESVFEPDLLHPSEVRILLKQHVGAPSVPVVEEGQTVASGACIALPPEGVLGGALGAKIHASIDGNVVSVTSGMVVLRRRE